MLVRLSIKNIALIECVDIDFSEKLNVLSGETGSGKSVVLESLNFVLGAKADKSLIRTGCEECSVRAEFDISNKNLKDVFDEADIEYEDSLIIYRKFTTDGKSSIKLNGTPVTASMLKKFTSKLVDIHGQSEHFYLLQKTNQLELIDNFCGGKLLEIKTKLKDELSQYKKILSELKDLGGNERERAFKIDILKYQINEIESFNLGENEELELSELKTKLVAREKIIFALNSLKSAIDEEGGADDILSNANHFLSEISNISSNYTILNERVNSVITEISDISSTASSYIDEVGEEDYNLDTIEERLDGIKNLHKKYGLSYIEINNFLADAKKQLETLENYESLASNLLNEKILHEKIIYKIFQNLNSVRLEEAKKFSNLVLSELKELNLEKAKFVVDFKKFPSFEDCNFLASNGIDEIEFMFSANLGEQLKPLSQVISGGEMSRFMLAIKTQTVKLNTISTLVFDEIDTGISGNVARTVAEKFAKISNNSQIIAISHLPQISAMADNNLLIFKSESNEKTFTEVKKLNGSEKINEIIRLVGGNVSSESAKQHAIELIDRANNFKASL